MNRTAVTTEAEIAGRWWPAQTLRLFADVRPATSFNQMYFSWIPPKFSIQTPTEWVNGVRRVWHCRFFEKHESANGAARRCIKMKRKIFTSRHNSRITFVAEMLYGTINIFYFLSLHRSSKSVIECISCEEYYAGDWWMWRKTGENIQLFNRPCEICPGKKAESGRERTPLVFKQLSFHLCDYLFSNSPSG